MEYTALILDVYNSQKYDHLREYIYKSLKENINILNSIYEERIEKKIIFGAGDECQGLFKDSESCFSYVFTLKKLLYPIEIKCGIGLGTVLYNGESIVSTEMDGSAYRRARQSINRLSATGRTQIYYISNTKNDFIINYLLRELYSFQSKYTNLTREIDLVASLISQIGKVKINKTNVEKIFVIRSKNLHEYFQLQPEKNFLKSLKIEKSKIPPGYYKSKDNKNQNIFKKINIDIDKMKKSVDIFKFEVHVDGTDSLDSWPILLSKGISSILNINYSIVSQSKDVICSVREIQIIIKKILESENYDCFN